MVYLINLIISILNQIILNLKKCNIVTHNKLQYLIKVNVNKIFSQKNLKINNNYLRYLKRRKFQVLLQQVKKIRMMINFSQNIMHINIFDSPLYVLYLRIYILSFQLLIYQNLIIIHYNIYIYRNEFIKFM